ncbi:MAG: DUF3043 domain-containing protein [Nocardioides sp.]
MFRRTKSTKSAEVQQGKPGGKGRPTPSRREAEAAARARAKAPRSRKELAQAQRADRAQASRKMREALRTGDDRNLPPRDQGPVRRFIRDFVDSRISFMEILLPVMVLVMVLTYSGSAMLARLANSLFLTVLLLVVLDIVRLRFRLRRELTGRFPDSELRGSTFYAVMRSMQLKFMRLPRAQVKIGQQLPERYR